ncbi:hypothetical protein [Lysinibacillus fusiformis]|uniref:hypothetical protein n=1 Tax=Lysinibacillus fusiformis TaxID=28031 RepID=UPI0021C15997|nr:hypothetical protein [Lysinibacillus fusiformis]UXJ68191.1 hypothetical protein N5069_18960 [Lysinibacillus fusiformis]
MTKKTSAPLRIGRTFEKLYNIKKNKLKKHTPDFFYTFKLSLNYEKSKSITGTNFENFINALTNNDEKLKQRLQELFEYVISEIRDVKYLPFIVDPKDTGKSILLRLLEGIIPLQTESSAKKSFPSYIYKLYFLIKTKKIIFHHLI